jgi:hypothetical protein
MLRSLSFVLLAISLIAGCDNKPTSVEPSVLTDGVRLDVKSLSEEEKEQQLAQAQKKHDIAAKIFSDLNQLRYEIQVEIGKAKEAGFSSASLLVELRTLAKELDVELAKLQAVTVESMSIIRQLQKAETGPMMKPEN